MSEDEMVFALGEIGPVQEFGEGEVTERKATEEELNAWGLK